MSDDTILVMADRLKRTLVATVRMLVVAGVPNPVIQHLVEVAILEDELQRDAIAKRESGQ